MQQQTLSSAQFGGPAASDMRPFSISAGGAPQLAEAAFPISSRPPPPGDGGGGGEAASNFDELAISGGEEGGGTPGNRWPRQETLALLKIRSDMDAAFREATFKGPLWEEVSRKLAELGYKRSAKKCKEKFENVHKYYKRTRDGRAGRQDGKTYRFFSQLEALHNSGGGGAIPPPAATAALAPTTISFATAMAGPASAASTATIQPLPVSAVAPSAIAMPSRVVPELGPQGISTPAAGGGGSGISFSWNSSSSSESESDDEDTDLEGGGSRETGRKRKRGTDGGGGGGSRSRRRMMSFFEGLIKQVMERQEAMQQRFLEAIEKREQDRVIREEAWRRLEMARLSREQELLAQERAMAASRDTAVISYLQKISGQPSAATISIVPLAPEPTLSPPPQPSPKPPPLHTPPKHKPAAGHQQHDAHRPSAMQAVPIASEPPAEGHGDGFLDPPPSSRWPKTEVHALIQIRSGLETRYQEAGPKGPLWEEISAGMKRLGYLRSAKRCKEKWENINKYFKKVKYSNKQRPEDAKTCPYFHQLDALYRKKLHGNGGAAVGAQQQQRDQDSANRSTAPPPQPQPQQQPSPQSAETEGNNNGGGNSDAGGGTAAGAQGQTSNGFSDEGTNKSEDAVKDLMSDYDKMDDERDSELNLDHEDEDADEEEDDENSKMQYKIQFQPQSVTTSGSGGANGSTAATATATAATAAGSFMAMVQ